MPDGAKPERAGSRVPGTSWADTREGHKFERKANRAAGAKGARAQSRIKKKTKGLEDFTGKPLP
jgi:hypothetical protein